MPTNLSTITGGTGFRIRGEAAGDAAGWSVSGAGDFNGDGLDDFIISADLANPNGTDSGATYVVFGTVAGPSGEVLLSSLTGPNGFQINGVAASDMSGYSVSGVGDVNGDGYDDILIGAPGSDPNAQADGGAAYVVFGKASGFTANFNLSTLSGANGFKFINGVAGSQVGQWVASAGDINGDGFDDVIVGAPGRNANTGGAYVVFGKAGGFTATVQASSLNGANGFAIDGIALDDFAGISVSKAGDINNDGFDDIIVGTSKASGAPGASYVVFGKSGGFGASLNLATLNGANGFTITGPTANDLAGYSVSSAGDINGDGFDDLVVGAIGADPNGQVNAGITYVVFGKASGYTANFNLSTLNGSNGFSIIGGVANAQSGQTLAGGGDFNGDGFDDIVIGAPFTDLSAGADTGRVYVVYGKSGGFAPSLNLETMTASQGLIFEGAAAGDKAGVFVSFAGDINNDGGDDIIVGASGVDFTGASGAGAGYVIYGTRFAGIANDAANTLKGGASGDTMNGLFGADLIRGYAGADFMNGGDGYALSANGGSVFRLYQATLDRAPDLSGFQNWTAALNGGQSLSSITTGFINSVEFQSVYGSLNNTQFVTLLYNNVLNRAPDQQGLNNWVTMLNNGSSRESVVNGFSESLEFKGTSALGEAAFATFTLFGQTSGQVFRLYQATLDRAPDQDGFTNWTAALASGQSLVSITSGFVNSAEFQQTYGSLNNTQFVTLLYNNVLNRAPDTAGLNNWVSLLNGGASRASVVNGFSESAEFINASNASFNSFLKTALTKYQDTLIGGLGDDQFFGGRGADTFDFSKVEAGSDHVYGYESIDTLTLHGFGFANAAAALTHFTQVGADVVFANQGETITFHDTLLATIQASTITVI